MPTAYIVDAVRTPIGKFGGALSSVRPDDLAAHVLRELMRRNPSVDKNAIEDVIIGAANQAGEDNRNVARMAALLAGLPITVPGNTVNRLCASGLQSIMDAARAIKAGEAFVEPPHVRMTGFNRSATELSKVLIFYVGNPGTPFLDVAH